MMGVPQTSSPLGSEAGKKPATRCIEIKKIRASARIPFLWFHSTLCCLFLSNEITVANMNIVRISQSPSGSKKISACTNTKPPMKGSARNQSVNWTFVWCSLHKLHCQTRSSPSGANHVITEKRRFIGFKSPKPN